MSQEQGSLRDVLAERGANEVQLKSKVFEMIEQALTDGAVSEYETCKDLVNRLDMRVNEAYSAVSKVNQTVSRVGSNMAHVDEYYRQTMARLQEIDVAASQQVITDEKAKNALLVYRGVLEMTADVFGKERMTDAVMCGAIEAGSYAMWRTVMGGKFPECEQSQERPRRGGGTR